ncbi:MAG: SPOR domain-containing protein [Gammaproteobacteria bacterium]|nr:SPOR domain-containing protein [Gammaproteobacteria bacterium]
MKKHHTTKSVLDISRKRRQKILLVLVVVAVLIGGWIIYERQKQEFPFQAVSFYSTEIKNRLVQYKNDFHQDFTKVKQIVVNQPALASSVHFEFYTTLPNMQVTASEVTVNKNQNILNAAPNEVLSVQASQTKKVMLSTKIFDAEKLQRALRTEFAEDRYILQLGVFSSASAAEHYKESLHQSGFTASIVKVIISGRKRYRVQIGPLIAKDQARLMQRKLQQKKINSMIVITSQKSMLPTGA